MSGDAGDGMMDAIVFKGKCQVAFERVATPRIQAPSDAIVKIDLCGLCGSDLHPYHCREQGLDVGTVMGHEFVGHIIQAGTSVSQFRVGDRVMSPFTTCCGACFYCRSALPCRCEKGQLFGWVEGGQGLQGAQAQFVRVPLADATLAMAPADVSDEEALLLGDIFSTGFFCAHSAGIGGGGAGLASLPLAAPAACAASRAGPAQADGGPGSGVGGEGEAREGEQAVVAVVGCGPVGMMAIIAARALGAAKIFAIDSLPARLQQAERLGAQPVDRSQCDPVQVLREATQGRGADAVLELVGAPSALRAAYDLVRPGGVISAVGCHTDPAFPFSPTEAYNKNVTIKTGRCPARYYMDKLVPLVQAKQVEIASIVSHRMPLRDGVHAYHLFDGKLDGCTKVVLRPWEEVPPA